MDRDFEVYGSGILWFRKSLVWEGRKRGGWLGKGFRLYLVWGFILRVRIGELESWECVIGFMF